MPDAENGTRQCRFGAEIAGAEDGTEAAVLHTDFDHHRTALRAVHAGQQGGDEAEGVAEQVVQDDNAENDEAACGNCRLAEGDDDGDDEDDTGDGNQRQGIAQELQVAVEEAVYHHARDDGQQHGFQNIKHHFARFDVHAFIRIELQQERREER